MALTPLVDNPLPVLLSLWQDGFAEEKVPPGVGGIPRQAVEELIVNESPHESKDYKGFPASKRWLNLVPFTFDPIAVPLRRPSYGNTVNIVGST